MKEKSASPPIADPDLPSFDLGHVYDRWPNLNIPYGGGRQGGISDSARSPVTFLFTGESGERYGYHDRYDDEGTFLFFGEGQEGDMRFERGNLAIKSHSSRGKALHLFRTVVEGKGKAKRKLQKYLGEFIYQDHEWVTAPDLKGNLRQAIIFHLAPVARLERLELSPAVEPDEGMTLQEFRSRAIAASKVDGSGDSKKGSRTIYERSRAVRDYVLRRAAGKCELCEQPAPFRRKGGLLYLEPHHTTRLSDGGPDHPQFVAALCPSCHREVHYGEHAHEKNSALKDRLQVLELSDPS
ncbi:MULTISPECIES: HNH endonuclease signature motif containing protein [unclassified Variovorax]|uniref:HNH endonuclease n=1 Tax=unclassified Variovorax TaxID=663243 RepID=UPI000D5D398D|nr:MULTISPECIES: HNH endonuclease signature motif containing protein [unclassified Variovorax]